MKKFTCGILLFLITSAGNAQNGLENVIVEKYYISDTNDSIASDGVSLNPGTLPVGSVTYRIYVDMLPGYKFQAAYGVPDHEWKMETTTLFYNNEDRGATTPTYNFNQAKNNTVMLDSWLSVGSACQNYFGVLKTADDGVGTIVNNDGVLQNNDPNAGIPLTVQDGFLAGSPEAVTTVGITNEIAVFDAQNDGTNGPLFSTWNGSLACLVGAVGPDSSTNQVLIAQITTDGVFSFELNLQLGTPGGSVENYVARNPVGAEILCATCIYPNTTNLSFTSTPQNPKMELFPNPASGFATMRLIVPQVSTPTRFSIYDLTGRMIVSKNSVIQNGLMTEQIDLTNLQPGIYFVEAMVNGKNVSQKLVVN